MSDNTEKSKSKGPRLWKRNSGETHGHRIELTRCVPGVSPEFVGRRCAMLKRMFNETVRNKKAPFYNRLINTSRVIFAVPDGADGFDEFEVYNDPHSNRVITYSTGGKQMQAGTPSYEMTIAQVNEILDSAIKYAAAAQKVWNAYDAVALGHCAAADIDIPASPGVLTKALETIFGKATRTLYYKLQADKLHATEAAQTAMADDTVLSPESVAADFSDLVSTGPAISRELAAQVPLVSTPVEIPAEPNEASKVSIPGAGSAS